MAFILFGTLAVCNSLSAQQSPEKPRELEALAQYVGDWTSDVTSRPAIWTPKEVRYQTSNHAEFVLNDWFLKHIEVNHVNGDPDKVTKSLFVWTFDPGLKKYVGWTFNSRGIITKVTGTWDVSNKTFTHADTDPPPNTTSKLTETFTNATTIDGRLVFTGNDGRKMFDMIWTRKRQAGVAGKLLQEQWAEIGKPIQPIPEEVKRLDVFIGQWNADFIQRPSIVSPQGGTTKATMTGQWILDGRFLLGRSDLGNFQSFWISGYDANRKAFRYVRFGSNGQIEENIGQWNEGERVFDWTQVNGPPGLTRTSNTRRLDNGTVESHILVKTQDGQTHMDLTIKSIPRQ